MTAQITLDRKQIIALADFCATHNKDTFFIAKDHGAYVGASTGETNQCIYYFKGCNPAIDADFYENARYKFGGDDFGELMPVSILTKVKERADITKLKITVGARSIKAQYVIN
jgi:hypothetical protein